MDFPNNPKEKCKDITQSVEKDGNSNTVEASNTARASHTAEGAGIDIREDGMNLAAGLYESMEHASAAGRNMTPSEIMPIILGYTPVQDVLYLRRSTPSAIGERGRKRADPGSAESSVHKRKGLSHSRQGQTDQVPLAKNDAENLNDIKQQAASAPNFTGDAYYYKLPDRSNRHYVGGLYTIVYTRPVGKKFDPNNDNRSILFPPSYERTVRIMTSAPSGGLEVRREQIRKILAQDTSFAFGFFNFEGTPINFSFCAQAAEQRRTKGSDLQELGDLFGFPKLDTPEKVRIVKNMVPKTTFHIVSRRGAEQETGYDGSGHLEYAKYPEFMKLLSKNLPIRGHTIAFGFKDCTDAKGDEFKGFHFIEIEVACVDATGAPDRQLIVAIRIPEKSVDLPLQHVLMQKFTKSHDVNILQQDQQMRAMYLIYSGCEEIFGPGVDWNLDNLENIGLIETPRAFNPGYLERHLIHQQYPIDELTSIQGWIQRTIQDTTMDVDERLFEASEYVNLRLKNLLAEQGFREEYDTEHADIGTPRGSKAGDEYYGQLLEGDGEFDLAKVCAEIDRKCAEAAGDDMMQ